MSNSDRHNYCSNGLANSDNSQSKQAYALPTKRPNNVGVNPGHTVVNPVKPAYACISPKGEDVLSSTRATKSSSSKEKRKSSSNSSSPSKGALSPFSEDWEARERMRQQELDEARTRAQQMEKTMRWWSDCTASWRDKWSKARNERNKVKEHNSELLLQVEKLKTECATLRSENEARAKENLSLKQRINPDISNLPNIIDSNINGCDNDSIPTDILIDISSSSNVADVERCVSLCESNNEVLEPIKCLPNGRMDLLTDVTAEDTVSRSSGLTAELVGSEEDGSGDGERMMKLWTRIRSAEECLEVERQSNADLKRELVEVRDELASVTMQCARMAKERATLDAQTEQLRAQHSAEVERLMEEERSSRISTDKQVAELQKELERLQASNMAEWSRREQVESEKLALERQNKKLRAKLDESAVTGINKSEGPGQPTERSREYNELRHAYSRTKKHLQDSVAQLEHSSHRIDQYEQEVKKLRARVEQLKSELAVTHDKVDEQTSRADQMRRARDELQARVTSLASQLDPGDKRMREAGTLATSMSSLRSFEENELHVLLSDEVESIVNDSNNVRDRF